LKCLRDLKKEFPRTSSTMWDDEPLTTRMKPTELLGQLEKIAPGFRKWAEGFNSGPQPAAAKPTRLNSGAAGMAVAADPKGEPHASRNSQCLRLEACVLELCAGHGFEE
jgi:hypothetical protein